MVNHDYAYFDSTEHHVAELIERNLFDRNDPDKQIVMSVEEARQYAKEKGIEWNANDKKTVTKYDLDKQLDREILKRELEQEIVEYSQYKDYTKIDNIARMGAAISGGVGALETAAMIGVGYLTGPGIIKIRSFCYTSRRNYKSC